jgi:zinc transport system substrate-binding protein
VKLRVTLILLATTVTAAGLPACDPGPGPEDDGRLRVAASFYPAFELATRVGGDHVEVRNLTPPGAEPHDLELTTDQVDAVLDAGLVVSLGGGFQPALEDALAGRDGPTLDLLTAVLGEDAEGGDVDPHLWLDPSLMSIAAAEVAEALGRVDGEHAADYRARARTFQDELGALDSEMRLGLRGCDRDLIVTAHDAFGRLALRYGLRVEAIAGISPEAEPDPARLEELVRLVEREHVTTIFTETLVSPEVAETLAREAGVRTRVLDPIEGVTEAGEDYLSLMRGNLAELREALGCP